jgi:hypothetical protein
MHYFWLKGVIKDLNFEQTTHHNYFSGTMQAAICGAKEKLPSPYTNESVFDTHSFSFVLWTNKYVDMAIHKLFTTLQTYYINQSFKNAGKLIALFKRTAENFSC